MTDSSQANDDLNKKLASLEGVRASIGEEAYLVARAKILAQAGNVHPQAVGDTVLGDQNKVAIGQAEQSPVVAGNSNQIHIYYQAYRQVEGQPALSEAEFQQFLTNYLTWVSGYYDQARLFGLERLGVNENRPDRSLHHVFIPLALCRVMPPRQEEVDAYLQEAQDPHGLEQIKAYLRLVKQRRDAAEDLEWSKLFTAGARLAVIGGPGCGKSTLLNYLAVSLAEQILHGRPLPFELTQGKETPIPLIVALRGFREYQQLCRRSPEHNLVVHNAGTLAGYILYALNHYGGRMGNFTRDGFERLLLGGGCLVMLDGLDEVVDRKERGRVRQQAEDLANSYPGNLFLVTAREAGYQENAILSDRFTRLDVRPLAEEQIAQLVRNWCQQLYPTEVMERTEEITGAIREINARRADTDLPPLVTTPLLTTMIVGVKWSRTQLPRERAKLYDAAVEVMLQLQYTRDDAARDELVEYGGTLDDQREWLWTLAYEMQRGGRASAAITRERMEEILRDRLEAAALERFARAIHERGGVFEERAGLYQFAHLTFQEFLAARCLVDRRSGKNEIARYAGDPWWRETLLLAYGCAVSLAPGYAREFLEMLSNLPGEARLPGLELAAAAVLEIEKPNPELRDRQAARLAACLGDPALRAPGPLRGRAGRALAALGDPRAEVLAVEAMGFCFVPGGPFRMGSRESDAGASDDEYPQHEVRLPGYWMAQHPVTQAQYAAFVAEGGYQQARYWVEAQRDGYWTPRGFKGGWDNQRREHSHSYGGAFELPNHRWWG